MSQFYFSNNEKNEYVKKNLEKSLGEYGELNYVYAVMNKKNTDEIRIISNLPVELVDNYQNNKFQNIDPVIINALNCFSYFPWDESLKIYSKWTVKKVFEPIFPYNIIGGHTFVLHDHSNNLAVLIFYIDKFLMTDIEENIRMHKDELQGVLINIHKILLHVYQDENKIDGNILSSRETEILYWSSTGRTYTEVADMLHITVSTVKFHMAKIVRKLGVRNAKHAIRLGSELNIASIPTGK